jgi:hypothetical protein
MDNQRFDREDGRIAFFFFAIDDLLLLVDGICKWRSFYSEDVFGAY